MDSPRGQDSRGPGSWEEVQGSGAERWGCAPPYIYSTAGLSSALTIFTQHLIRGARASLKERLRRMLQGPSGRLAGPLQSWGAAASRPRLCRFEGAGREAAEGTEPALARCWSVGSSPGSGCAAPRAPEAEGSLVSPDKASSSQHAQPRSRPPCTAGESAFETEMWEETKRQGSIFISGLSPPHLPP